MFTDLRHALNVSLGRSIHSRFGVSGEKEKEKLAQIHKGLQILAFSSAR